MVNAISQETYFENLYDNNENNDELEIENPPSLYDQEENITLEGLQTAINKLKNRKSLGIDNIPNELLKYGGPEIDKELTRLYEKIKRTGLIPEEWKINITLPIYKEGSKWEEL